jgi:hypothetical protein
MNLRVNLSLGKHGRRSLQTFTADGGDFSVQRFVDYIPIQKNQGIEGLPLG